MNQMLRKNNRIVSIWMILLVVVAVVFFVSRAMIGQASEQYEVTTYYHSYEVQAGDNLWQIADEYYSLECGTKTEYINTIKSMNHLETDCIHAGEHLLIPYYIVEE